MAPHTLVHERSSFSQVSSTTNNSSLPDIVSNFQDLSAVLSIFAADTVESKVADPRANDLERMSTTWSIFGIVGMVRAYTKLAAGIHSAEKAGVDIYDLGGYTSEQTKNASSACTIGCYTSQSSWRDDRQQLLGQVDAELSRWKRPNIIVMGYSQCPFEGKKALREILGRSILGVLTVIITCLPLFVLRKSASGDLFSNIALGTAAGSAFLGGCLLPLLIQNLNPVGVMQLRDLQPPDRSLNSVLQGDDTVITSKTSSTILWQKPYAKVSLRSGDRVSLRLLAALSACVTVVVYVLNYLELGRVQRWRAYSWLGIQTAILTLRFVLWATRPRVVANRPKSVLFFITGSLVSPLAVDGGNTSSHLLHRDVVHFAVASASSKVLNGGGTIGNLKLQALDKLSDVAPADILTSGYCDLEELTKRCGELEAIRLPWSWMEEIYAAQGLILGHNPWALGGLYLAAIVEGKLFHGLTTIHPRGAGAGRTHGEDTFAYYSEAGPSLKGVVGITVENYGIRGDLVCGIVTDKIPLDHDLMDWHAEFRENVYNCRLSAVSNGPPHYELHVRNFGEGPFGSKRVSKTVPTITAVLEQGLTIGIKEREKDHSKCKEFCTIFGF